MCWLSKIDPTYTSWSQVLQDISPTLVAVLVKGGAHHLDLRCILSFLIIILECSSHAMIHSVLDNIKSAINIKTKVKHSKTLRELKDKIHVLPSPQKLTAF